jgi:putative DNA primase/helicase
MSDSGWSSPGWREAALEYHRERKRNNGNSRGARAYTDAARLHTGLAMTKRGLIAEVARGKRIEAVWICAPFEIVGRVRDPKSEGWARLLRWRDDDGRTHEHPVSDADLHAEASALCSTLANRGLRITTGPGRAQLIRYLNSTTTDTRVTILPSTGWHDVAGKKTFVLPGVTDGSRLPVIVAGAAVSPYAAAGTLAEWQDSVARLAAGHNRAMFAIATAFAAPLLEPTGADSGGFNLRGLSSIGKTTLLRAAASVWGRGDEHGIIRTWRATGNGLEGTAALYSNMLLPLDELGVAGAKEVGDTVYSLASGIGKQRAQRDGSPRAPNIWRVMILSTGELTIPDKIREAGGRVRAGQEVRILDIEADAGRGFGVFDHAGAEAEPEKLTTAIKTAAITYYGTAGPAFVAAIEAEGLTEIASMVRDAQDAIAARIAPAARNGQVLRAARRFALVSAAGELAIQLGVLPWTQGIVTAATEELFAGWWHGRGENDPAEIRDAIEHIRTLLDRYGDSRFDAAMRHPDMRRVSDRLGWVRGDGPIRQWLIPPGIWRTVFCDGADQRTVARALAERGMLLPGPEGKHSRIERVDGEPTRVYVLTAIVRAGGAL